MGRTFLTTNPEPSHSKMLTHTTILATLVLSATSLSLENAKAASSSINCGCQCSSITFLDSDGNEQGNCKTVDGTGAQWCYVDHLPSSCQDMVPSERFPHNPWSYEACATPSIGSLLCPVDPDHVHAPVVVAPADHVHVPAAVHDYVGQHNTEIPQGGNAPIPKAAGLGAPSR